MQSLPDSAIAHHGLFEIKKNVNSAVWLCIKEIALSQESPSLAGRVFTTSANWEAHKEYH